jgi:hypothetical protein
MNVLGRSGGMICKSVKSFYTECTFYLSVHSLTTLSDLLSISIPNVTRPHPMPWYTRSSLGIYKRLAM